MALVRSIEGFDPSLGYSFATYAVRGIRNAIRNHLDRTVSGVSVPWRRAADQREYAIGEQAVAAHLKREPTRSEVFEYLGWDERRRSQFEQVAQVARSTSIDAERPDVDTSMHESIADPRSDPPLDEWIDVDRFIESLSERDRAVLFTVGIEGYSMSEAAEALGVSRSAVSLWMKTLRTRAANFTRDSGITK